MNKKIGIIGLGNVGTMLLNKFMELNLINAEDIYVSNRSKEKLEDLVKKFPAINVCKSNRDTAAKCDNIFLCVEPLNLPNVLFEIKPFIDDDTYLMISTSMVAHKDLCKLHNGKITIFMPTLISLVNSGVTLGYHNEHVTSGDKDFFEGLMSSMSEVKIVGEEDIKLSQNLTASFPGFFAEIMSEFVKSVSKHSKNVSDKELEHMLLVSLSGASMLLLEKNMSFEETIDKVSTKGGITYEGVKVYKARLPEVFDSALEATISRYEAITEKSSNLIDELFD